MGYDISVTDIIMSGGATLALLIVLSVYSIGLIWERWRFHKRTNAGLKNFLDRVRSILKDGNINEALTACRNHRGLASNVILASLTGPSNRDERRRSTDRAISRAVTELLRGTGNLGTIASIAPFIGLFGTVLGVMRAFKDLAQAAGAGPGVVAVGISEALICTAAGLFVAIPAITAYNYFVHKGSLFADEMGWITDEILESLSARAHK